MALERFADGKYVGWLDPSLRLPIGLLGDLGSAETCKGGELLLRCRGRLIVRVSIEVEGIPQNCFLYLFRNRSFGRSLRTTYAFHIMGIARRLQDRGFATLDVFAALKPRRQFLNWDSFLVAREILQVAELPSVGRHVFQIHEWAPLNRAVTSTVARQIAAFHNAGFIHGDLKSRHVLLRGMEDPENARVILVDLEKAKHIGGSLRPVHDFFAARDLIQLLASLPFPIEGSTHSGSAAEFLDDYLAHRNLRPRRSRLIQRIIALYGPQGRFQQGKTFLQCLAAAIRHGKTGESVRYNPVQPNLPLGPAQPTRPGNADTARQSEPS